MKSWCWHEKDIARLSPVEHPMMDQQLARMRIRVRLEPDRWDMPNAAKSVIAYGVSTNNRCKRISACKNARGGPRFGKIMNW